MLESGLSKVARVAAYYYNTDARNTRVVGGREKGYPAGLCLLGGAAYEAALLPPREH